MLKLTEFELLNGIYWRSGSWANFKHYDEEGKELEVKFTEASVNIQTYGIQQEEYPENNPLTKKLESCTGHSPSGAI